MASWPSCTCQQVACSELFSTQSAQEDLKAAIEDAGFEATVLDTSDDVLHVKLAGMSCAACEVAIEGALRRHAGVLAVSASLLSQSAEVRCCPVSSVMLVC